MLYNTICLVASSCLVQFEFLQIVLFFYCGWFQEEPDTLSQLVHVSLNSWRISTHLQWGYEKNSREEIHNPSSDLPGYFCPNGVYLSRCTISLLLMLTEIVASDIGFNNMALATRTTFSCFSCSTADTRPSILFMFAVFSIIEWRLLYQSYRYRLQIVRDYFSFLARKNPCMNFFISDASRRTDFAMFLIITNATRLWDSPMRT